MRPTPRLLATQGHIWREGFLSGQLKGELYRDVPDALAEWRRLGIKTYIYSSGSRWVGAGPFMADECRGWGLRIREAATA